MIHRNRRLSSRTPMRVCKSLVVTLICGAALAAPSALAQDTPGSTVPLATVTITPNPTPAVADRTVPRGAMQAFLEACAKGNFDEAAALLNLRRMPKADRKSQGPRLARQLSAVLDRKLWIDLDQLSDEPEGETEDGLPKNVDLVGTLQPAAGPVQILLERVWEEGTAVWKISSATVAQIPALYQEFGYGPLGDVLPSIFFEVRIVQVQLWQWIGLLLLVIVAWGSAWLITRILVRIGRSLMVRSRLPIDSTRLAATVGPLRSTVAVLIFYGGIFPLALSIHVHNTIAGLARIVAIIATTWLLSRLVDVLGEIVVLRQRAAAAFVPLGRRTFKVLAGAIAFIVSLQSLGFNASSLLAGLGIGGLAIALAGQKSLEQFFGSVTLVADQPVRVGDFCRFGDTLGTVEDIGLRSTRVRTLERTVVSVPNAEFAAMQIENFARRDRIWLHTTIGVRYETTPDQLRWLLVALKRLLLAHPKVHPDPARARFVGFGAYSLDIEIFAYVLTADINEFLAIREDIFLRIMETVNASGSGFAFPSQTNYVASDTGVDDEKRGTAESEVKRARAENALWLPDVPAPEIAAIRNTLEYPPPGSASRRA